MPKGVLGYKDDAFRTHEFQDREEYSIDRKRRVGNALQNKVYSALENVSEGGMGHLIGSGDDDVHVKVYNGATEPQLPWFGSGDYVFHRRDEDPNEEYSVFEQTVEEYDLDQFLDEYDLHGSIEMTGTDGETRTLVDTENRELNRGFKSLWNGKHGARAAWKKGRVGTDNRDGTEYLTDTENLDFLAPLMFTVDAEEFEDYEDLANRVKVNVPELYAEEQDELVNKSKPSA